MRIDATAEDGSRVSAVQAHTSFPNPNPNPNLNPNPYPNPHQAHTSFRRCVGQSCAEFTLALLEAKGAHKVAVRGGGLSDPPAPEAPRQAETLRASLAHSGVFLPEELFAEAQARAPMLERLLATPGTLNAGFEQCLSQEAHCLLDASASAVPKVAAVDVDGFDVLMPGLDGD